MVDVIDYFCITTGCHVLEAVDVVQHFKDGGGVMGGC